MYDRLPVSPHWAEEPKAEEKMLRHAGTFYEFIVVAVYRNVCLRVVATTNKQQIWKYGLETMTQPNICPRRRGFKTSPAHHWSDFFLEIRYLFHTSILLSNWILTNQQTTICNLGSDAYFEYTSCNLKIYVLYVFWIVAV
jgi:hypothetical protein